MIRRGALAIFCAVLAACAVGPDFERPEVAEPMEYREPSGAAESLANLDWWKLFDDARMRVLIELALEQNKDLAVAVARIDEARARYGFVRADQFPIVDGRAGASRGRAGGSVNGAPAGSISENYVLAGDLSYEIDLFGKLRRSTEAARAELLATEEGWRSVMITLIADVASAYLLLRDLDARYEIAQRTLQTRQEATGIIRARFDKGTVAMIDVNQAEIEEADAEVELAATERAVIEAENLLNVLVGRNPGPIIRERGAAMRLYPPNVPSGLPSELLERRPDIRRAEQVLAAQTARIGVAQALRLPSLSLTGTLGLASDDLSDLLSGDAKIWSIGGNLLAPIFNAGRNKRNVEIEKARFEQSLRQYEQTVLLALSEVETTLAAIRTLRDEALARQTQVVAARSAAKLSRARYDGGVTSYLEVLESERSLFRAELAESSVRREQLVAVVTLYKALGGGWLQNAGSSDR